MPNSLDFDKIREDFNNTFAGLYTNLANVVREKTKTTEQIALKDMAELIRQIPTDKTDTPTDKVATITENWPEIIISPGLINYQTIRTVPAGTVSISGNEVNITAGYINSETKTIPAGSVSVSGNKVNITEGYVSSETKTVAAGSVTLSGNKVNITEGYVAGRN